MGDDSVCVFFFFFFGLDFLVSVCGGQVGQNEERVPCLCMKLLTLLSLFFQEEKK